jgi:G3E family GTPase
VLVGAAQRSALDSTQLARAAVIEVDRGEDWIDHDLVIGASITPAEDGCICCGVAGTELAEILEALFWQRLQGKLAFDRVVIVSPVAVHAALFERGLIAERFALETTVTKDGHYLNHRKSRGFSWAKLAWVSDE